MDYKDVPEFMNRLSKQPGIAAASLTFLILGAARSGEVRNLEWTELDLDERVWTIPGSKMKAGKEHRVPLTDQMIKSIEKVRPFTHDSNFVFSSLNGSKPLSNMAMSAVLKRMKSSEVTVHGFRSSFRDWVGDATNYSQ